MCRRRERASADRRVRSGPACSSAPAEQNEERRRRAPAKQLRQWRSVRNFSPESPPCCIRVLGTGHSITPAAGGEGPRQAATCRRGALWIKRERLISSRASPLAPNSRHSSGHPSPPLRATKRHQAECSGDRIMLMDNRALLKDKPPPSTRLARICAIEEVEHEQQNRGGNDLAPDDACNPRAR